MNVLYNPTPPKEYEKYKYVSIKGFLETPQPKSVNDKVGNESKYIIVDKKNKKTYQITFIFDTIPIQPIQDATEKYKILYGSYNDGTEIKNPTTSSLIENFDLFEFKNQTGGKSRRRRQTKNKRKSRRTRRSRK